MTGDGTQTTPNAWFYEGAWRDLGPFDEENGAWLRRTLAGKKVIGFSPVSQISGDPGWNTWEANHRAALHAIVDELSREDLWTLYRIGHLLFVTDNAGEGWRPSTPPPGTV